LADTALSLAVDQSLVRGVMLKEMAKPGANSGVNGDPRRATAQLGQIGVQQVIEASVAAIRKLTAPTR
jgi:creatinine amidohydrolase/Fe(II)-dependent formamide hydrolase-like protein